MRWEAHLFRVLLAVYPAGFRRRNGADMALMFAEESARRTPGIQGALRFWSGMWLDFVATVPRAWWTHATRSRPRRGVDDGKDAQVMANLVNDTRYAIRGLVRQPGLAITAITALGLGIGLTTIMFSVVNGIVLQGLPVDEPHEIVAINRLNEQDGPARLAGRYLDFVDLRERQTTLDGVSAIAVTSVNVSPPEGNPEFVPAATVSANMFDLLGIPPLIGRGLEVGDEIPGAPPVAVVGYRFWQDRLGGDRAVLGRTVRIDGRATTIVGIMPSGYEFPINQQVWTPFQVNPLELERASGPLVIMMGRLKDGVGIQQAQSDLARIMAQLGDEYPQTNAGMTVAVGPYVSELIGVQVAGLMFTMLGAVSLVLVIACANVANLLLARASLRGKEVAVRTALGAKRSRVMLQMLVEATIIAIAGASLGMAISVAGLDWFNAALRTLPGTLPFWFDVGVNPTVVGFVMLLTLAATILSGLIPAVRASGTDVNAILKDESRGSSSLRIGRLSRSLVVVEVALSCALLVGAGLMIKSVSNLRNVDYAFTPDGVFVGALSLPAAGYEEAGQRDQFFRALVDRLEGQPGVIAAAVTTELPVVGFGNGRIAIEGEEYLADRDYPNTRIGSVTPTYFDALEAGMLEGRTFTRLDNADNLPVAIVNESFARRYFADETAIGKRVSLKGTLSQGMIGSGPETTWYTIVGVAPDLYLDAAAFVLAPEALYTPIAQRPVAGVNVLLRTEGDPLAMTPMVRREVAALDPDLPLAQISTLEEAIANAQWAFRIFGTMFSVFGVVALFLATIGLYGVLSFSVNQRSHEVGLRVALGATPSRVLSLIMRQGLMQLGLGLAIGSVLALGLGRALSLMLFDVAPADLQVLGAIGMVLLVTGAGACFLPARRATRVDPLVAMRTE